MLRAQIFRQRSVWWLLNRLAHSLQQQARPAASIDSPVESLPPAADVAARGGRGAGYVNLWTGGAGTVLVPYTAGRSTAGPAPRSPGDRDSGGAPGGEAPQLHTPTGTSPVRLLSLSLD